MTTVAHSGVLYCCYSRRDVRKVTVTVLATNTSRLHTNKYAPRVSALDGDDDYSEWEYVLTP